MSDFLKVLNVFDIFTNLIPGTICLTLLCILLPNRILIRWIGFPDEKYVVFLILCYFYGMLLNGAFNTIKRYIKKFFDCNKKYYKTSWIYGDKGTKELAERLIKQINIEKTTPDSGKAINNKKKGITENEASYAIKYMFIKLNMSNKNTRKDKLSALSDMNGVMGLGIFIIIIVQLYYMNVNAEYFLLGYKMRVLFLSIILAILIHRCIDYQHHKYVQTLISYDILINENAKNSAQKEM